VKLLNFEADGATKLLSLTVGSTKPLLPPVDYVRARF